MNNFHFRKIKQLKDWERDLSAVLVFKNDMDEETRNDTIRYRDLLVYAIEQVERVQELEEELVKYRNSFELQLLINNNIKNQIKRYREALEEIRNHGTYELNNALKTDYGWIAHEALEGESNE